MHPPVRPLPARLAALWFGICLLPAHGADLTDLTFSSDGSQITITDCLDTASGDLVVPNLIDGLPVTAVANHAFQSCNQLTSIVLPNTVTSIGSYAFFNCDSMTSFTCPLSIK